MSHQDWTVVTLKKKTPTKKVGLTGTTDNLVMKSTHLNKQNKSNSNASKIEQQIENDEFELPKVNHNLQLQLQQARQAKNMTQKQLAQAANLTESVVKSYETGKAVPSQNDINKMSKALGVTLKNKK